MRAHWQRQRPPPQCCWRPPQSRRSCNRHRLLDLLHMCLGQKRPAEARLPRIALPAAGHRRRRVAASTAASAGPAAAHGGGPGLPGSFNASTLARGQAYEASCRRSPVREAQARAGLADAAAGGGPAAGGPPEAGTQAVSSYHRLHDWPGPVCQFVHSGNKLIDGWGGCDQTGKIIRGSNAWALPRWRAVAVYPKSAQQRHGCKLEPLRALSY